MPVPLANGLHGAIACLAIRVVSKLIRGDGPASAGAPNHALDGSSEVSHTRCAHAVIISAFVYETGAATQGQRVT